ncbi:MAG: 30S ribosomal protein S20 [Flavobacteriaceae bacterium]|jgi:small subunit ribosomal protein S20|nr:30S ribosomal protein S20 [Flavobacteriaceae bacterium]MDG1052196.1 30S ribosomal protein S20 [Flavobacteriaceae bacterium]MDG1974750.1 30S ribosomal protein S20 [Flavobacteriaceae bacterium]MDG2367921.1 30S ribosomal protein S20 [Flavobacteriaceae bacterium]|tara:strand:+ start:53 stop:304 length:252 start_codon:yes stop_codon:yes gene_type:complete
MANHKSALKRIRRNESVRLRNKLQHKATRNAIKKLKDLKTKKAAAKLFPTVVSMLDKLVKNNIIHSNKSANLKSKLSKHVAAL